MAASGSFAPIRLATRVDAAMDTGNGTWNVVDVSVTRMLWAASSDEPNWPDASVRTSKAKYSASTMSMPGSASQIMGPLVSLPS